MQLERLVRVNPWSSQLRLGLIRERQLGDWALEQRVPLFLLVAATAGQSHLHLKQGRIGMLVLRESNQRKVLAEVVQVLPLSHFVSNQARRAINRAL